MPDVFRYELPQELRVQIVYIVRDGIPEYDRDTYRQLHDRLLRELGLTAFSPRRPNYFEDFPYALEMFNYFLGLQDHEVALSCVEFWFTVIEAYQRQRSPQVATRAIRELNARFLQHGIGYQFSEGRIIRVDSALIHQKAVKPALVVLRDKRFSAAEGEFLNAYEHYRHGRHEEALTDATKALESVLKVICKKQGWKFDEHKDTASKLLNIAFTNGLVPSYLQTEFNSLKSTLEAGVPTIRNKQGGHGAGEKPRQVPGHLVSYALHLTASSILFLTEAEAALK